MLKKKTTVRDNLLNDARQKMVDMKVTPRDRVYEVCGFFNELGATLNEITSIEHELCEEYRKMDLFQINETRRVRRDTLIRMLHDGELVAIPVEGEAIVEVDYLAGEPTGEEFVTKRHTYRLYDKAGFQAVSLTMKMEDGGRASFFMHKNYQDDETIVAKYTILRVPEKFDPKGADTRFWMFQACTNK